jgi:hypothetical protein
MADISFSCPECGGDISVDEKTSGMSVSCPLCSARISFAGARRITTEEKAGVKWEFRREQTVATVIKSSHGGGSPDGKGAPRPMPRMPERPVVTADASFRGELQPNGPTHKTYRVQGCLPVLAICIGAFVSICGTAAENNRTMTIGAVLVLGGIVWAAMARRISAWLRRG